MLISILTCFAGGVFLGIIFLDLLADALDSFNSLKDQKIWDIDYPLVQLIALLGFFAVYSVDEFSARIFTGSHMHNQTLVTIHPEIFDASSTNGNASPNGYRTMGSQCDIHTRHESETSDESLNALKDRRTMIKSLTFVMAIIFHSTFDGLSLGVQDSDFSILSLFFGLMVHKSVVAFSVGLRLIRCHKERTYFVVLMIFLFAITSPIFAGIGMLIENLSDNNVTKNKVSTILVSASMGTFLYISFFEMLAPERENDKGTIWNLIATFVGFGIIAVIMIWSS
uniref:Uncharacterized protein n=1 Tax=Acrobeloides nanus TaxID=290746 RepID=A0A914EBZ2_9BILA